MRVTITLTIQLRPILLSLHAVFFRKTRSWLTEEIYIDGIYDVDGFYRLFQRESWTSRFEKSPKGMKDFEFFPHAKNYLFFFIRLCEIVYFFAIGIAQ